MNGNDVTRRKQAIVDRYGPWIGYNIHLGDDLYTIERGKVGVAERNIRRVLQIVSDQSCRPLSELRILDLGAHEGGFAIEFARQGAEVVAIEGREGHVAKANFVKEILGLTKLEIVLDDVRRITPQRFGAFDVVLCLGILYHLDAVSVVPFVKAVAEVSERLMILETQMSLKGPEVIQGPAGGYRGRSFPENIAREGAAIDNTKSMWLTRSSLLNLLSDAGFTSVAECLNPPVLFTSAFANHGTFLAMKGQEKQPISSPEVAKTDPQSWRWPENMKLVPTPEQLLWGRVRDRIARLAGRGVHQELRRKQGPR